MPDTQAIAQGPWNERIAVVTGATSGIGRQVAIGLAAKGATTVVVGRGEERARQAAREISAETGNLRVESIAVVDLAVRAEMRRVAEEVLRRYPKVHILVNNAGGYIAKREVTSDGLERTFALNVLAPFVLTSLLAGRMKDSAPARVVDVASAAHQGRLARLDDLQSSAKYSGFEVYGRSKLELILLTREFSRRLQGTGVSVNAVHPGFVHSGFGQNNRGGVALAIRVLGALFGRSERRGADTPVFVASDPSVAEVTGQYFANRRVKRGSEPSNDLTAAHRLFSLCAEIGGIPELPEPTLRAG
jgi:retinol dehydrogenase 14